MATMKHRKLFPTGNETAPTYCSEFCDPPCSYNCYPYPDFYYQSPPPPPPPLSANDQNDQSQNISPYVIVLISFIAATLLIVGYYIVIAKSCAGFCRRNNDDDDQEASRSDGVDEEFIDLNSQVDHPIWFITTVGLQQSIINSITVCRYKKSEGLIEGTECSVCLNEFQEEETLRLLPKCNHAFHIPCIDTWLRSHTNCPLCRTIIFTDYMCSTTSSTTTATTRPILPASSNSNVEVLVISDETQMGIVNSENDVQLGENCTENEGEHILQIDDDHDGTISKELVNSQELQSVRRCSVSMDESRSSSPEILMMEVCDMEEDDFSSECDENSVIAQFQSDGNKDNDDGDEGGNSSSEMIGLVRRPSSKPHQRLHLGPVSMKRSFSCGARFLPTKHHRSFNSVIPL